MRGRNDEIVAAGAVPLAPVILHERADQCALRMKEGQPRTDFGLDTEQVELAAETAVVALLLFLALPEVVLQVLLSGPHRS